VTLINVIAFKKTSEMWQVILPERTNGTVENCKHYTAEVTYLDLGTF
jgi:hypothetical protein